MVTDQRSATITIKIYLATVPKGWLPAGPPEAFLGEIERGEHRGFLSQCDGPLARHIGTSGFQGHSPWPPAAFFKHTKIMIKKYTDSDLPPVQGPAHLSGQFPHAHRFRHNTDDPKLFGEALLARIL